MVGPLGVLVSPYRRTPRIEGRGPHHHVETARRWCSWHMIAQIILTIYLQFKGELGELQIYFRKIPLHQQNFSVVSILSNSLWLLKNLKNV